MSNQITFTPGKDDAKSWAHDSNPVLQKLIYLDVRASDGHFFSGWVTPDVAKLAKAAPKLLAALQAYVAAEEGREGVRLSSYEAAVEAIDDATLAARPAARTPHDCPKCGSSTCYCDTAHNN